MRSSVTYLGNKTDADGLHTLPERVKAVKEAPTPRFATELKSYLGMLLYCSKSMPNLSTVLHALYTLLHKNVVWH